MGTARIRLKMLPFLLSLTVAIVSAGNRHHRHVQLDPTVARWVELGSSLKADQDVGYSECSGPFCSEFDQEILRMKRQDDTANAANDAAAAQGAPATNATGSGQDSNNGTAEVPLPPPVQVYPKMPKNFPFPNLDVVQQPPVPTRARKIPRIQSPYPAAPQAPVPQLPATGLEKPSLQDPLPVQQQVPDLGTPIEPVNDPNAADSVKLPDVAEAPEVQDLSEFTVPGTNDAVVQKPSEKETPPVASVGRPDAAQAPSSTADQPRRQGPMLGPEDWRFSEQAKRRCKTAFKQPCAPIGGPAMAGPPMAGPPMGQRAPPAGCRTQQAQPMAPGQPSGSDPWKSAEQKTAADLNQRDDTTPPEGAPAESAGERHGLAVVALVLANGLYLLM
ncbi:proline-rich extensin-like protein EPR1 [Aedes aegypti]|nr:proline-rich extensin-like protein EPR1 [Aedes aegypti]